jgi:hypothetical protein
MGAALEEENFLIPRPNKNMIDGRDRKVFPEEGCKLRKVLSVKGFKGTDQR